MKYFQINVDRRSRSAMTGFLQGHFRYSTLNSWNRMSSYANNIKVHRLGLPDNLENAAFELFGTDYWEDIADPISDFTVQTVDNYTIGTNGRSGGYLVLYDCRREKTGHLSYCPHCGQPNFKKVPPVFDDPNEQVVASVILGNTNRQHLIVQSYLAQPVIAEMPLEPQEKLALLARCTQALTDCSVDDRCGVCKQPRTNYVNPPSQLVVSYRSIDQEEDFEPDEWSMARLRDRVELVTLFDRTCDQIRANFIDLLKKFDVVEEIVMRPQKIKRLQQKAA